MASQFPNALDQIAADKANATISADDHPGHHNQLAHAINAVQRELGVDLAAVFKVARHFEEIANNEPAKAKCRHNLGLSSIDGGTFN